MTTNTDKNADARKKRAFVHRYKWSHEAKRKKFRRMKKDGKATIIEEHKDGWLYAYQG